MQEGQTPFNLRIMLLLKKKYKLLKYCLRTRYSLVRPSVRPAAPEKKVVVVVC